MINEFTKNESNINSIEYSKKIFEERLKLVWKYTPNDILQFIDSEKRRYKKLFMDFVGISQNSEIFSLNYQNTLLYHSLLNRRNEKEIIESQRLYELKENEVEKKFLKWIKKEPCRNHYFKLLNNYSTYWEELSKPKNSTLGFEKWDYRIMFSELIRFMIEIEISYQVEDCEEGQRVNILAVSNCSTVDKFSTKLLHLAIEGIRRYRNKIRYLIKDNKRIEKLVEIKNDIKNLRHHLCYSINENNENLIHFKEPKFNGNRNYDVLFNHKLRDYINTLTERYATVLNDCIIYIENTIDHDIRNDNLFESVKSLNRNIPLKKVHIRQGRLNKFYLELLNCGFIECKFNDFKSIWESEFSGDIKPIVWNGSGALKYMINQMEGIYFDKFKPKSKWLIVCNCFKHKDGYFDNKNLSKAEYPKSNKVLNNIKKCINTLKL